MYNACIGSFSQVSQPCLQSTDNQVVPTSPTTPTAYQHTTVNSAVSVTTSPDCSCNQSANMLSGSSDAGVKGILGGVVVILFITVVGLFVGLIYYRKESRSYR